MEHAFNPRTWEAEATGCVRVRDQPDLHDEFQDSQGYILRPCLKKRERKKEREREREKERKKRKEENENEKRKRKKEREKERRTPKSRKQPAESFHRKPRSFWLPQAPLFL